MRRPLFPLVVVALVALPLFGYSQKQVAIKFNMTSPFVKTFNIAGEWAFSQRFSGQVVFYKTNDFSFTTKNTQHVLSGWGFTPEGRVHLRPQQLKGLYLGGYVRLRYLTWEIPSEGASATINTVGGGFTVGYQAVIKNLLILDFYIGPSFGSHALKVTAGVVNDYKLTTITTPVGVRSGIAIGIAVF